MSAEKLDTKIRQDQIIRAAMDLIAAHGLKGLSMAGLARRIGLVPSAIYRHFRSKDDLIDAMLDFIRAGLLDIVASSRHDTEDAEACLRVLLTRHITFIRENHVAPRIIFSEEVYSGKPERKHKLYDIISEYLESVRVIVEDGQEDNIFRSDVTPQTVAIMFLGLIQPVAIMWHLSDGGFDVTKHAEKTWHMFKDAIKNK